ncbi:Rhodanese domain protein [Reticulomyxa filosa]|uniref:Rhodanese domain protein n=1 Tax=Reticulomyxa filosa TaxID=46433 RepID=X6NUB8_RETFI|nr:Rhodanese domain protein [Reticulomyxa filosa]|eukprot:ETO29523.1 Rhodanese domain protein [Reticulomyxa filosa]
MEVLLQHNKMKGINGAIMNFSNSSSNISLKQKLIALLVAWTLPYLTFKNLFPNVKTKSTQQLFEELNNRSDNEKTEESDQKISQTILLDIREKHEYDISHIGNAVRINSSASAQDVIDKLKSDYKWSEEQVKNTTIYCYCSVGYRSAIMADKLTRHGLPNVYNIDGSLFKWCNEKRPMIDSNNESTQKIHTYNSVWGMLVDSKENKVC